MNTRWIATLAAALMCLSGCPQTGPTPPGPCLSGSRVCEGNIVMICPVGGQAFVPERVCPYQTHCFAGECVSDERGFAPDTFPDGKATEINAPDSISTDSVTPDTAPQDGGPSSDTDPTPSCGNGSLDPGESCDPGIQAGTGTCPTSCTDPPGCTDVILSGSANDCSAECITSLTTVPIDEDGCCPPGATAETDSDCVTCGNQTLDVGETCDNSAGAPCPTACPPAQGCTTYTLVGSPELCSADCQTGIITATVDGDGCCPSGSTDTEDSDCTAVCGNGQVEPSESCDGSNLNGATCPGLGFSGAGVPSCLDTCQLSTLSCEGAHLLGYEKVPNITLIDDVRRVRWHPSGTFALLLGAQGRIARYDHASNSLALVEQVEGRVRALEVAEDGSFFLIVGTEDDGSTPASWRAEVSAEGLVSVVPLALALSGIPEAVHRSPTGHWVIGSRQSNGGGVINRLARYVDGEGIVASKAFTSGSGLADFMFASPSLFAGSDAVITSEGINGANSQTWVIETNEIVGNGWSPGYGNSGGARWRPGGHYGILVGTSSAAVYIYDGAWSKDHPPGANSGATGNAIAWRADGSRALLVGRPTGLLLVGTVKDYRPGAATAYNPADWIDQSIPGFGEAPWSASTNTHLLGVDWRPATPCHEGLIVGADTGSSFNPSYGTVIRFYDTNSSDCEVTAP